MVAQIHINSVPEEPYLVYISVLVSCNCEAWYIASLLINPRCTCAARVTVVGLSVCLLSHISLHK